ncbi:MAG: hypothetical protein IH892_23155, partial [Planctomycetes bacterium]|nr:hypothetical protein [Planctomycetota bacterium]
MTPRRRVNYLIPAVTVLISAFAASAHAQTVDELQRQLEAQQEINAQLRQRVLTLEETIESLQERNEASAEEIEVTPDAVSSTVAVTPADEMLDVSDLGALEQALVQRGSPVLPPYSAQVVPVTSWSHSGSSALGSERNSYDVGLAARMGLPRGMMAGVSVPYV